MNIRPSAAIRQNYNEIAEQCRKTAEPVFLTKNGYGSLVVLSLEQYAELTDDLELALDEADKAASLSDMRYSSKEVFSRVRGRIHDRKAL